MRRLVFHFISEVLPTVATFYSEFNSFDLRLVRRRIFGDCHCLLVGKNHGLVDDHTEALCIPPRRQLLGDDLVLGR